MYTHFPLEFAPFSTNEAHIVYSVVTNPANTSLHGLHRLLVAVLTSGLLYYVHPCTLASKMFDSGISDPRAVFKYYEPCKRDTRTYFLPVMMMTFPVRSGILRWVKSLGCIPVRKVDLRSSTVSLERRGAQNDKLTHSLLFERKSGLCLGDTLGHSSSRKQGCTVHGI